MLTHCRTLLIPLALTTWIYNGIATDASDEISELFRAITHKAVQYGCQGILPIAVPPRARVGCTKKHLDELLAKGDDLRKACTTKLQHKAGRVVDMLRFFRAETIDELALAKEKLVKAKTDDPEDFVTPGYLGLFEWSNNVTAEEQIQAQRGAFVARSNVPDAISRAAKLLREAGRRLKKAFATKTWMQASPLAGFPDRNWLRTVINEGAKLQQYLGFPEKWDELHEIGAEISVWKTKWQRPTEEFIPDLRSVPVWDKKQLPASTRSLEKSEYFEIIRKETFAAFDSYSKTPDSERAYNTPLAIAKDLPKAQAIQKFNSDGDQNLKSGEWVLEDRGLHHTRDWHELQLFSSGYRLKGCHIVPQTCDVLEKLVPSACRWKKGGIKLSAMEPGTRAVPHTGSSNNRLRLHLGIQIPDGAILRVADQNYTWIEGRLLVFDDSFEHEVWQGGNKVRLILNIDFPHPDLKADVLKGESVKKVLVAHPDLKENVPKAKSVKQLHHVERNEL